MPRKAVITGATGQDGHYLSEYLSNDGMAVYGLVRRCSRDTERGGVPDRVIPIEGDVRDPLVARRVAELEPDEIYNLAAVSHVGESFHAPHTAIETNTLGCLNMLEAARLCGARVYQASTSEMFGNSHPPQRESTRYDPQSPYAVAKVAAAHMVKMYRDAYGVHACSGILFNHESPIRGADFVTQKVCRAAVAIAAGSNERLELGNTDAKRDWGHARDYVRGMVSIMRNDYPADFVLATGITRTVADLCRVAFGFVGIANWREHVTEGVGHLRRPADVHCLRGEAALARVILGWVPTISFEELIGEMIEAATARHIHLGQS